LEHIAAAYTSGFLFGFRNYCSWSGLSRKCN